jgi:phage-related protein
MSDPDAPVKRRWRLYRTAQGNCPVADFIDALPAYDRAQITAAMAEVKDEGLEAARHLQDEIYEVRVDGRNRAYRVLFAAQGRRNQILLALEGFVKKTQMTPRDRIEVAKRRLADWQQRGRTL